MEIQLVYKTCKMIVIVACIIATIYLSVNCLLEYLEDKDNSTVSYRNFHQRKDYLYPSVSLCFKSGIFIPNSKDYKEFLSGCQYNPACRWNASLSQLDYDRTTKNLINYVIGEITIFADNSNHTYLYNKIQKTEVIVNKRNKLYHGYKGGTRVYISRRRWDEKCLTFDMPFWNENKIKYHSILLNNSVFPQNSRPQVDFEVFFHYPNQTLRQTSSKSRWSRDDDLLNQNCNFKDNAIQSCSYYGSTYTMSFDIDNISVYKRRNKQIIPCLENWKNDDTEMKTLIAETLECQPGHWYLNLGLKNCTTQKLMKASLSMEKRPFIHTCNTIERYAFSYEEMSGLLLFDIGKRNFIELFGIDWDAKNTQNWVFSEIAIHFPGTQIKRFKVFRYDL